jgi:deazaflavin-dependent oxidoreductase (nitroreductase family)
MSVEARLPGWLKVANPVIVALQRRGLAVGTMHLLTVPGRRSGKLRTTPVSPLTVDGRRYIIAGLEGADWVKNVRASGWVVLARGRKEERVGLVELPVEERAPILREFPRKVPHGVQFFRQLHGVSADPEEFAALAPRCPVFRVEERCPGANYPQTAVTREGNA